MSVGGEPVALREGPRSTLGLEAPYRPASVVASTIPTIVEHGEGSSLPDTLMEELAMSLQGDIHGIRQMREMEAGGCSLLHV